MYRMPRCAAAISPRLEAFSAGLDSLLDVQGAHQPVFGGADREVHYAHLMGYGIAGVRPGFAELTKTLPGLREAAVGTAAHHVYLGQQRRQGADRGGLGGPLFAPN